MVKHKRQVVDTAKDSIMTLHNIADAGGGV